MIGAALMGWLLADLLSGLVHWWQDRLARDGAGFIGERIVRPNRLHHSQPLAFLQNGPVARNLETWLLVAALSGLWAAIAGISVAWAAASTGGLLVNEVHRRTHMVPPLRAYRVLQEIGLVQSPRHHAGHHRDRADRRYCVLTDWLNPVLDALRLWDRLEALLGRLGITLAPDLVEEAGR